MQLDRWQEAECHPLEYILLEEGSRQLEHVQPCKQIQLVSCRNVGAELGVWIQATLKANALRARTHICCSRWQAGFSRREGLAAKQHFPFLLQLELGCCHLRLCKIASCMSRLQKLLLIVGCDTLHDGSTTYPQCLRPLSPPQVLLATRDGPLTPQHNCKMKNVVCELRHLQKGYQCCHNQLATR